MMDLIKAGLFGANLIRIDSPELVRRYNQCLLKIGKEPTKLQSFQIDGIGWSPEIAEEKKDTSYLSYSEANPCGIILTPDQKGRAIQFPFHSFDRNLMRVFFKAFNRQIACLTSMTALYIELDERLSLYRDPRDLLMIDLVIVKTNTVDGIISAAREQRELVSRFTFGENWSDPNLRKQIIDSGNTFGDLRSRPVIIEDLPISEIRSFYARVFGGVYVFRDDHGKESPVLILEDGKTNYVGDDILRISDREKILKLLLARGLVEFSLEPNDSIWLEGILDSMMADLVFATYPRKDVQITEDASWNGFIAEFRKSLPNEYFEIERLKVRLESGESIGADSRNAPSAVSKNLLLRPKKKFEKEDPLLYDLLMQLLVSLHQSSPQYLYAFNKPLFFERYAKWPKGKKHWAIGRILANNVQQKQKT